ncbi:queuine tRNA-ribosyltransferase [Azospirillum fermentarium]|uniref:tRNA guanosine(34) transglycosylase Tgt n=1 Tax=Azospirillum fermentarium TaxID=1233114 RepID=UPI002227CC69|nr:tRNA guanosine(34) transglycosylase Tgt [Azospirillum fermentarium]MCW2246431.1 queuine tRNA-ribosyltransferase [Azospirillum fermentarium]
MKFELVANDGAARRGTLHTAHGVIDTPAFMPVGTAGTVKAMHPEQVRATGAQIILGNTYHLMLRPTAERVAQLGGLHRFMNWPGPILTDSGGFQVMSLNELRTLDEDGVTFKSHLDGSRHRLTPERSMEIQHLLDSDVTMAFDECTPFPATHEVAAKSMRLSMKWAQRCRDAFVERPGYGLFGIVQGSVYPDLRSESVAALTGIGFDGYAVGGLAVGEGQETMFTVLDHTMPLLPAERPRYLMGVGRPSDIIGAVRRGIDMFDCVMPTRSGRTGQAFVRRGVLNLRNARHAHDDRPLDDRCACPACRNYSRGYIHHLIKAGEMLGPMLLTWHNLQHYQDLMAELRAAIEAGEFEERAAALEAELELGDIAETPDPLALSQPARGKKKAPAPVEAAVTVSADPEPAA